ncbi:DUF6421 family protein [Streptomyces anulatus]|uniref:DUF6421 family protein n=1 Tax=Streptomyces anulatus TaxID=1892 RepID=UPI002257FA4E|nr:DUF6421 family protein [Streptomyces anulatus]MCX4521964.1 DUF6421 family protein [Streptomyces anulatus]MCX4604840.1 DUF6421 family protein [Streptomyces anulatus]WTE29663.1 DUF6421 family protein [Streptomyces anulatus]
MSDVFAEIDELRQSLPNRTRLRDEGVLKDLVRRLEARPVLRRLPAVEALLEDLRGFTPGSRMESTKKYINSRRDHHVFSLFDASYFPSLSLDWLTYETLPTDPHLAEQYASNTLPVNVVGRTRGFASRVVVALFPENHLDGIQEPDDVIFYFIDKFVERHQRITRLMLDEVMAPGSFPLIQQTSETRIEQAATWWVRLHEYHHRHGDMPIPEFLSAKKSKPLAGLEELRVDVSGMLTCLDDEQLPRQEAQAAFEFILAERLLRYAVEGIPRPNYDAVASQLLFNYLVEHEGIRLHENRIVLLPGLTCVLRDFLGTIKRIEAGIHHRPLEAVREELLAFTNRYTDYDPVARDYRHIPYFAQIKQRLGV